MAGIVLEDMAYESMKTITPAYYNIAICGKFLRDDESVEMMQYIVENRMIDLGVITDYGDLHQSIKAGIYNNNLNYVSLFESKRAVTEEKLQTLTDSIKSQKNQ
jgi:hypothetical protein